MYFDVDELKELAFLREVQHARRILFISNLPRILQNKDSRPCDGGGCLTKQCGDGSKGYYKKYKEIK